MAKFNMGDLLDEKTIDIPKSEPKRKITPENKVVKKQDVKKPIQDGKSKFEPMTSWYRGTAELLKGKSVRGTELNAINVIIQELEKRKQEILS
ncbi:hypothetical protein DSAG12_01454 [Promethearchaeum syntrophicum]|uniref:Uncharacterized protein n=1 Tax=Promethearchaeum syntrophicum TaxID=2594042 RepID=A0A5B9D8N8_9ARCH|nr:hypothetical protein [Candidatus Prometheoarchaeum syntrophicum]QEE15628.1 hypothetical protein DSAG12_01454 [Candidatus Prometheoarchaeum syntrophicum]